MAQKPIPAGVRLTEELLNGAYPKGVVYQGNRDLARAITNTNSLILRLDGMALDANRVYLVTSNQLHPVVTAGAGTAYDKFQFQLRYLDTGVAVTATTGTEISRSEAFLQPVANAPTAAPLMGWVRTADAVPAASVALTGFRQAGSNAGPNLLADPGGIWLTVIDMGVLVGDTGTDL